MLPNKVIDWCVRYWLMTLLHGSNHQMATNYCMESLQPESENGAIRPGH